MSNYHPATSVAMLGGFLRHRELLWELVKRDFIGRYKGSMLGVVWSLFNPLLMLTIYTVVFSVAFKARWGAGEESKVAFAIVLFSGMIIHSFFVECLSRVAFFRQLLCSLGFLPAGRRDCSCRCIVDSHNYLSLILMALGFSWIIASLGDCLHDLSQLIGMATTVALPEVYWALLVWNPITLPVIQLRDLMLWGKPLQWSEWAISLSIGLLVCQIGYWWFQKSRRGFAMSSLKKSSSMPCLE